MMLAKEKTREMLEFITGSIAVIGIFFLPLPLVVAGVVVGWWFLSKFGIVRRFPIESYFRSVDIIVPFLVPLSDDADMKGCLTTYRDMSSGQESSTTRRAIGSAGVM